MDIAKCLKPSRTECGEFIEEYLFTRENIGLIILLIDIRHKVAENDKLMYNYIKSTDKPYMLIATKADKIAVTKVNDAVEKIRDDLGLKENEVIFPFSSERKIYIEGVWDYIDNWSEKRT